MTNSNPLGINEFMTVADSGLNVSADQIDGVNYDRASLGVNTLRVRGSSTYSYSYTGLGSNNVVSFNQIFIFTDVIGRGVTGMVKPFVTLYIDTDRDSAYIWPNGSSVSSLAAMMTVNMDCEVYADLENNTHKLTITVHNLAAGAHNFYAHARFLFLP